MEVFDLAAKISVIDGASKILGVLSANVLGLGKHFEDLEKKAHGASLRIKTAMVGIGTAMAGVGLFEGLSKFEEAGESLVHVKTLFLAALPAAERVADMAKVTAAAFKESSDNMRSTLVGNVAAMHDLYVVTQSVDHATQLLPAYNRLANAFASVKDQEGLGDKASGGNIASAIRAIELTGRNTADKLEKATDAFVRTTIALGEKAISGGQLMTQISNAGDSRYGWSDEFLTKVLPAMIATGLQNRTGSALNALSNNLYGGVASSKFQGKFQEKWGLHNQNDELIDETGKFKGFKVGTVWEGDKLRSNPLDWANDFREMLHSKFNVDTNDAKKMQDIIGEVGRGNKLFKAALDELLLPQTSQQLNKELGNVNKVGADALPILDANDPKAVRQALAAKWKDAMDALGEQLVQPMLDNVIKPLTKVLSDVTQFAAKHPDQMKKLGIDLLKVTAGLVAMGTVLTTGALIAAIGPGGWLIVGLAMLGTTISIIKPNFFSEFKEGWASIFLGIKYMNLKQVGSGLLTILKDEFGLLPTNAQKFITDAVHNIGTNFETAVRSIPSQVGSAISQLGTDIAGLFKSAIGGILGKIGGLFSRTSFEDGGVGGGGFIPASFGGGGRAGGGYNDTSGGGSSGNFSGSEMARAHHGMDILQRMGWTKEGAASLMSQAMEESNINPNGPAGDHGTAHGMFQWRFDRFAALKRFASSMGRPWTDFDTQIAFAATEAKSKGLGGWAGVHDLYAGGKYGKAFEGYGTNTFGDRLRNSQEILRSHEDAAKRSANAARSSPKASVTVIHNHTHLDGKVIASSTTRIQADRGRFPTAVGGIDAHGSFASPGTPLIDAA